MTTRSACRFLVTGAVVAAVGALGATAGTSAQAAAPRGAEGCFAQGVATVNRDTWIVMHDLRGTSKGATVKATEKHGPLGSTPRALSHTDTAGDPSGAESRFYALSASGRLSRVEAFWSLQGLAKPRVVNTPIGRGFGTVAMAATDSINDNDPAYIYIVDRKGDLKRYTYSERGVLGKAALVAKGLGTTRSMDVSRRLEVKDADGAKTTTADVLLLNDARSGALKEIVVPRSAPSKPRIATLARSGWGGYAQVQRLECSSDTRGGLVAMRANGTAVVFSDANMTDLSGRDIRKVGPVSGRFAR